MLFHFLGGVSDRPSQGKNQNNIKDKIDHLYNLSLQTGSEYILIN